MTCKHTPGPWLREGATVYALTPNTATRRVLMMKEVNRFSAGFHKGHNCPDEELEANVLLALAGPDLLKALKGAIGALEFSRDYHYDLGNADQAFCQDLLDAALQAIAKAEGREP